MVRLISNFIISLAALLFLANGSLWAAVAAVCPFCSAINLTFAEQIRSNDIVVIAKLTDLPEPVDDPDAELPKAEFEVTQIVKGKELVQPGQKFKTLLVGRYPVGKEFLVMGVDPPNVAWSTPMKTSTRINDYLNKIQTLPQSGAERLAFFQEFFEDEESVLAFDAYDEFASASYDDLKDLRDQMDHEQLVAWINDPSTSVNRRRLYFTMLGVCGNDEDVKMLEGFIRSGDRKQQAGLDALVACYLTLHGEDGVDLVEETFLANKEADYVDTLAAVSALRFHGTDENLIPQERIVAAIRHLLDRPKMADMIIPDLARWEDWSVVERLVQMFKDADDETNWLRVPVITYLRACPKPEAKQYIEQLREIDPDAVRRADFFLDFDDDNEGWGDEEEDEDEEQATEEEGGKNEQKQEGGSQESGGSGAKKDDSGKEDGSPTGGDGGPGSGDQSQAAAIRSAQPPANNNLKREHSSYLSVSTQLNDEPAGAASPAIPHTVRKPAVEQPAGNQPGANQGPPVAVTNSGTRLSTEIESRKIAQANPAATPVAMVNSSTGLTWQILLIPMAASMVIFLLLWSVFNGWFERLIY
ncbi:MAG: hypothetical protein MK108_02310 [Mariniblastus sp.]|nr:hypothetical protein [Mariniblastus sp.]